MIGYSETNDENAMMLRMGMGPMGMANVRVKQSLFIENSRSIAHQNAFKMQNNPNQMQQTIKTF